MKKTVLLLSLFCIAVSEPPLLTREAPLLAEPSAVLFTENDWRIKPGQQLAVLLTGNDALLTRIVEDAIAIHLANSGIQVSSRERLETTVADLLAAQHETDAGGTIGALAVGKAVGVQLVITGTVIADIPEGRPLLVEQASFQVVDVESGQAVMRILLEWEDEGRLSSVGRAVSEAVQGQSTAR